MKPAAAIVAATIALLASCSDPDVDAAHEAEAQANIVQSTGDLHDICEADRAVQSAWLKAKDLERYQQSKLNADVACRREAIEEAL